VKIILHIEACHDPNSPDPRLEPSNQSWLLKLFWIKLMGLTLTTSFRRHINHSHKFPTYLGPTLCLLTWMCVTAWQMNHDEYSIPMPIFSDRVGFTGIYLFPILIGKIYNQQRVLRHIGGPWENFWIKQRAFQRPWTPIASIYSVFAALINNLHVTVPNFLPWTLSHLLSFLNPFI